MAHAHAELTGEIGIALATAGPGVTNTLTGVANATISRVPVVVIGGCPPRPQTNMAPLQEVPQVAVMAPVTRYARCISEPEHAVRELDRAVAAALGDLGEAGASYIEFPTDVLRENSRARRSSPPDLFVRREARAHRARSRADRRSRGRDSRQRAGPSSSPGAARAAPAPSWPALLERTGALYLDTQESRGILPDDHPADRHRAARPGDAGSRPRHHRRPQTRLTSSATVRRRSSPTHASSASRKAPPT